MAFKPGKQIKVTTVIQNNSLEFSMSTLQAHTSRICDYIMVMSEEAEKQRETSLMRLATIMSLEPKGAKVLGEISRHISRFP